jgi:hypothetical protein
MIGFTSKSQFIYFDKQYDFNQFTENTNNILPQSDGSFKFIYTGIRFTSEGGSFVRYLHIKGDGDTIETKLLYDNATLCRYQIASSSQGSNNYLYQLVTYQNPDSGNWKYNLIVYSPDGEIACNRKFELDSFNLFATFMIVDTIENVQYIFGQASTLVSGDGNFYVIKVDTTGFVYWNKSYGGNNYESPVSALQTPDGGFLSLGWTRSFGAGQRDWYLVKADSLGNQEWQKTYGTSANEGGWGVTALIDGNYILTGGKANSSSTQSYGVLKKVNQAGDLLWSKDYVFENNYSNSLFWTKELSDGSLVSVGLTHETDDAGYLQKTDSEGNLIWQHKYNKGPDTDLFYNVLPTSDGGFLLSGQCQLPGQSQDAWLLKVDSLGCPYPNCTVGIEEENKTVAFNLWPNPANEVLNVEVFNSNENTLCIKDMLGKEVYHSIFSEAKIAVDVSLFKKGLYMVEVNNSKNAPIIKKVVID